MDVLFFYYVGYYVGLDVYDVFGYGWLVVLKKGYCVMVELGVYVLDDERFFKYFRGLVVRIEDSVVVDEEGLYVLMIEVVKEVEDIEVLRQGGVVVV